MRPESHEPDLPDGRRTPRAGTVQVLVHATEQSEASTIEAPTINVRTNDTMLLLISIIFYFTSCHNDPATTNDSVQ